MIARAMTRLSLRAASLVCVAIWAGVWLLWLLLRFSSLDLSRIPAAGPILLSSLVLSVLAPIAAVVLAGAALVRGPRQPASWLALGLAAAVLCGQWLLFLGSRWL